MKPLRFDINEGIASHAFVHDNYAFCFLISEVCDLYWLRLQIADKTELLIDVDFGNYSNINSARLAAWLLRKFILYHNNTVSIINDIKEQQVIKNMKKRR